MIRQKALMDEQNGPAKMRDGLNTTLKGESIHKNQVTAGPRNKWDGYSSARGVVGCAITAVDLGYSQETVRSTTTALCNKGRCIKTTTGSQLLNFTWNS